MAEYDVEVVSHGFDTDRILLQGWQLPEAVVLKILDLYGNAANKLSICRVPEHEEENDD